MVHDYILTGRRKTMSFFDNRVNHLKITKQLNTRFSIQLHQILYSIYIYNIHPLVIDLAMENGMFKDDLQRFTYKICKNTWWFAIATLNYQRVDQTQFPVIIPL